MLSAIKRNGINLKNVLIIQVKSQNLVLVFHTVCLMSSLCQDCTKAARRKVFSQETCIGIKLVQHMTQLFLVQSTDSLKFFFFFSTSQRVLIFGSLISFIIGKIIISTDFLSVHPVAPHKENKHN